MPVTVTKSNATVPTIPNDNYDVLLAPGAYLFSVYENLPFSMDLTFFMYEGSEEFPSPVEITSVNASFTTYNTVTFTVANTNPYAYKITVNGNLTGIVGNETYSLLLANNSIVQASPASLPEYLAVVDWNLPTSFSTPVEISTYSFTVNSATTSELVTMSQYVYWNFNAGIADFRLAIAGGTS
jgi:hypothetical protein